MMRLIGGVRPPSETTLLRQFHVNKTSTVRLLRPALIEASGLANDGRSYAASAPSDVIQARKPQKRVPKNERKSMVENYVKGYRETNAGKFPSVTDAKKNVGGSYYTIRQILQEMIHNSKQPPSNTKEASLEKSTTGNDKISANIGVVSPTRRVGTVTRPCVEDSTSTMQNTRTIESTEKQEQQSSDLREASVSDEANIFQQADKSEDDGSKSHKMQNTRTIESTEKQELQSSDLREASVSDEANIFQQTDKSEDDGSQSHKMQYTRTIESTEKQEQQSSDLREASVSDEANIFRQTDKSEDDGSQSHEMIGKPESSQIPDPENNIKLENLNNNLLHESAETLRRSTKASIVKKLMK